MKNNYRKYYKEMLRMTQDELETFLRDRGIHSCYELVDWLSKAEVTLSNSEIAYLRAVIAPFRDKVVSIYKEPVPGSLCNIIDRIVILTEVLVEGRGYTMVLAPFPHMSNQYKGMELNRSYSVEELGL